METKDNNCKLAEFIAFIMDGQSQIPWKIKKQQKTN